jgi:hypothetical protein
MLDYKWTEPYMVSKAINKNAYKLNLSHTIWKHNIFHVSLLDHYSPPTVGQPQSETQLTIIDNSDQWEVNQILDSKRHYRKLHYLVQWAGYSYICTSWEPAKNHENAQELVDELHWECQNKHRQ